MVRLLRAVFDKYRRVETTATAAATAAAEEEEEGAAAAPGTRLGMAGWLMFCKHALVLQTEVTGVAQKEAVLIFHLSRMLFSNPQSSHAQGMSFCEFLEGVCRLADTMGPPSVDELRAYFKFSSTGEGKVERSLLHDYILNLGRSAQLERRRLPRRPSAGLTAPKTRPLVDKLPQTLALVESAMLDLHEVRVGMPACPQAVCLCGCMCVC